MAVTFWDRLLVNAPSGPRLGENGVAEGRRRVRLFRLKGGVNALDGGPSLRIDQPQGNQKTARGVVFHGFLRKQVQRNGLAIPNGNES
jgi:hypothetical protein